MELLVNHPEVATRDCNHCQQWLYDLDTGLVKTRQVPAIDDPSRTVDQPIPRYKGILPPCQAPGQSCPKGSPTAGIALTSQNWAAYTHFRRCETLRRFPEDSIVERNAGIIGACLRSHETARERISLEYLRICAMRPMA